MDLTLTLEDLVMFLNAMKHASARAQMVTDFHKGGFVIDQIAQHGCQFAQDAARRQWFGK